MSETTTEFRMVIRGYEPAEVDRYVKELSEALEGARHQTTDLTHRVEELEVARTSLEQERGAAQERAEKAEKAQDGSPEATFTGLGERLSKILILAEEEATEVRAKATADAEGRLADAEKDAARTRKEADSYASDRRASAEGEAEKLVAAAEEKAVEVQDDAERAATARREEGQAILEQQRAEAAKAAADFETALAERRERAEQGLAERTDAAEQHLAAVQLEAEQLRAEAEQGQVEARAKADRMVSDAQRRAQETVREAKDHAEKVRAESERELAALARRRDSINAQLSNVRQMLATLTGGSVATGLSGLDKGEDIAAEGVAGEDETQVIPDWVEA